MSERLFSDLAFSLDHLYDYTLAKNFFPWGHDIHHLIMVFLGHHCFILRMSDLCSAEEKRISDEIRNTI